MGSKEVKPYIYVDTLKGKKIFLDFWKFPLTTDINCNVAISIVNKKAFEEGVKNALVLLEGQGEPKLCSLGNGIKLFTRIFPINNYPERLKIIDRIYDDKGKTISYILKDKAKRVIYLPFFLDEVLENFYYERYIPSSNKTRILRRVLKLYYKSKPLIPRFFQVRSRHYLSRIHRKQAFPNWPLETSLEYLKCYILKLILLVSRTSYLPFIWFWPEGKSFCVILTHDVESSLDGNLGIYRLIKVENNLGFKSSFNIVPFKYNVTKEKLKELRNCGCEIGLHDYSHDGQLFSSWEIFQRRIKEVNKKADEWQIEGFRSASTFRNQEWFSLMNFSYDSSIPDTDPYEPQPGGCLSLFPFFINDIVEIPITLPQDFTLLSLLKEKDIRIWRYKTAEIKRMNGLVCVISHPDEGYISDKDKEKHYSEFLEFLRDSDYSGSMWNPFPGELARWWRKRNEARIVERGERIAVEGLRGGCVNLAYLSDGELRFDNLSIFGKGKILIP